MAGEQKTIKKRPEKNKKKDDSVSRPQQDKLEGESSGLYSKIIFFVLISILGLAVGVIVFQLGPLKDQEIMVEKIADIPESQPEVQLDVIEVQEASYPQPVISDSNNVIDEPSTVPKTESKRDKEPDEVVVENIRVEEQEKAISPVEEAGKLIVDNPIPEEQQSKPETSEAVDNKESSNINFESQLEDDSPDVPEESFIIRAERETIQEAVDRVWGLTVDCIEELRALHSLAKSQLTYDVIGVITKRLEPLRTQLDTLVHNTYNNIFDGALEQAAQLESSLRAVLDDLEDAKKKDIILAKEEAAVADLEAEVESASPVHHLPVEIQDEALKGDVQEASSPIEIENEIDEAAADNNN